MPELPEVETIRRGLSERCIERTIREVKVFCEKSFVGPKEVVLGARIVAIRRRGKALLFDLSNGVTMMMHLRMTGQLVWDSSESSEKHVPSFAGGHPTEDFFRRMPGKQTRVEFDFDGGKLFFNDQRKFGFVKPIPTKEVEEDKFIASLGPEPWEMRAEELFSVFQRRKGSPVKAILLDQKVVAGIGNIYADEACFFAGVYPGRLAGTLEVQDAAKLLEGAGKVMQASIDSGGSTMATYVRPDGSRGDYLEKFAEVFRREGKECRRCGAEIVKVRVAGRGTHYCPECQK